MKIFFKVFIILCIIGIVVTVIINLYMILNNKNKIDTSFEDYEYALVLGAAVWGDGPSPMLEDRILTGVNLYKEGKVKKLIMSGAGINGKIETKVMMDYAINKGVNKEDIIIDSAGLSTYDSFKRLADKTSIKKVVIITQKYHLYRSIYDAENVGITATGVSANLRTYPGQIFRDIREVIGRCKDYVFNLFKFKYARSDINFEYND